MFQIFFKYAEDRWRQILRFCQQIVLKMNWALATRKGDWVNAEGCWISDPWFFDGQGLPLRTSHCWFFSTLALGRHLRVAPCISINISPPGIFPLFSVSHKSVFISPFCGSCSDYGGGRVWGEVWFKKYKVIYLAYLKKSRERSWPQLGPKVRLRRWVDWGGGEMVLFSLGHHWQFLWPLYYVGRKSSAKYFPKCFTKDFTKTNYFFQFSYMKYISWQLSKRD